MGRKNGRTRQARLQRKRGKRAASRSGRKGATREALSPPQEMLAVGCLLCCHALLAGERLSGEPLKLAYLACQELAGPLGRIPLELNAFLFEGQDWTLTCAELKPLQRLFGQHDAEEVYERLWSLALTLESDPDAFGENATAQECAHRAAYAFDLLWACLDDRRRSPGGPVREILDEAGRHGASSAFKKACDKLLRAGVAAVHATDAKLPDALAKLGAGAGEVFDMARGEEAEEAWWECNRLFLKEVLRRLQARPGVSKTPAYAELARRVLEGPQAAVELARGGAPELLRSVHLGAASSPWRAYLEREIDLGKLSFDDRVRYEITHLKLLRAQAGHSGEEGATVAELLTAFQSLQALLTRGVPPPFRDIGTALRDPLVDFYVEMLDALRCEEEALPVTEELLKAHPEDFRLACLYATGALEKGEHARLKILGKQPPVRHIAPEIFARGVRLWSEAPRGMKAAATLRASLFDPLDREDRKQLLIALSRQCLRRALTLGEYTEELAHVVPYFPKDSFVYAELREKTALESSLVFLATMLAPVHGLKLSLTEEQSQQWVSHAREIARQTPLGSELALRHLKNPKGFTLAPGILQSARAHLEDFQHKPVAVPAPPPEPPKPVKPAKGRKKRRRGDEDSESSPQKSLFDAFDP